jgi:ABC-2 type transport system ATP-binding protein
VLDGSRTLAVKVADKGPAVQQVIRLLDAEAIVPESLAIREPTLDDVFLQLTGPGAGLAPDEPAPQAAGALSASQGSPS